MNNNFVLTEAEYFAERLRREAGPERAQVELAYQLALGRSPTAFERAKATEFIRSDSNGLDGLIDFCHALFNLNEFVYRP